MNATFMGQLDTHVQILKDTDSGKSGNEILLQTIKLLLREINGSDNTLSEYEKLELRQFFLSLARVAEDAGEFYQKAKNHLDPEVLSGEIVRRLEAASSKINETIVLLEEIEKNSAELFTKESELESLSDEHKKREARASELRTIKETITPEVLGKLEAESNELSEYIKVNQVVKDELDEKIEEYKLVQNSLDETIAQASSDKTIIEENVVEIIVSRIETMREICKSQEKDLEHFKKEIEKYKSQYLKLVDDVATVTAEHSNYELHLGENSKICTALREHGVSSIDNFKSEIENLEKNVREDLERFDGIIRNVIKEQEEIKEMLIDKSKPKAN
jgi:chromosome segregation ATPase